MKMSSAMTPIQIASSVIEKLQEQNRISLETLHKSQNNIRYLEGKLAEKEQLIKILEDKLRTGSNSFLEMSNRQKEITIKHLELQIQKLLKENQDVEQQINVVKSDICARCETKYLLGIPAGNKVSKSSVRKVPVKGIPSKQPSQNDTQNREKMLERIIEHKDKRILYLSKEMQKLSQTEKELTNKIYRLTKLLPMSNMPSEVLTECLLKEIQSLETQIQLFKGRYDKLYNVDDIAKFSNVSNSNECSSRNKLYIEGVGINQPPNSSQKVNKNFSSHRKDHINIDVNNSQKESVMLMSSLHKLHNDISELKQLFASEQEKLYQGLTREALRKDVLKIQWEDIISRLNDIGERIRNIIQTSLDIPNNESANSDEKDSVILRLQDRLRDSLELTTRYENDITVLRENIEKLKDRLQKKQEDGQSTENQVRTLFSEKNLSKATQSSSRDLDDVQHLKGLLNEKQKQLDSAERHLNTCQNFIEELKKAPKESQTISSATIMEDKKLTSNADIPPSIENTHFASSRKNGNNESSSKSLETKLEVAERNIKALEDVIEGLQKVIESLKEENTKLESDLNIFKCRDVSSETNNIIASLKAKLKEAEDKLSSVQAENKDLENSINSLEKKNLALEDNLQNVNSKLMSSYANDEERTSLQIQLDTAEKHISTLEANVAHAQTAIERLKDENSKLLSQMQSSESEKAMSEAYQDDVMSLKNKLIMKEDEVRNLKESLEAFEHKAYEMNHYRKQLREEIEKLCDVLLEKSESKSSASRKAIYKAAVLRSAQVLLQLDEDYNVLSEDINKDSALEEMKHQVSVYLTEVARIHELLTIKEQQREELLKQYLDLNGQVPGPELSNETHIQENYLSSGVESLPPVSLPSIGSTGNTSSESGVHSSNKNIQTDKMVSGNVTSNDSSRVTALQEELNAAKSITTYLLSKCSQLEELLEKERTENTSCQRERETYRETIQDLKSQLNVKSNVTKRLNTLIEMMRSKECNDEIAMEQLKSEIQWLVNENQKVFEKITVTQSELSRCKEDNSRMQNDVENLKRQLVNEKYEHAKVNNELKHLRVQIINTRSSTLDEDSI